MVNIQGKACAQEGGSKRASFGMEGSKVVVCCLEHAENGIAGWQNLAISVVFRGVAGCRLQVAGNIRSLACRAARRRCTAIIMLQKGW